MSLFPKLLGSIPPELLGLLSNPGELGKQVQAFYNAATALLDAIEEQKSFCNNDAPLGDMSNADDKVWLAAEAFRAELNKLPPLNKVTK